MDETPGATYCIKVPSRFGPHKNPKNSRKSTGEGYKGKVLDPMGGLARAVRSSVCWGFFLGE